MDKKHDCQENLSKKWRIEGGKAYAKCKICGWFETNLFKAKVYPRTGYKI